MDDEIPPLLPPDEMASVTDQATLHHTWRALMGPLGFADRQLWVLFLSADGRPLGVTPVHDVPPRLDADEADLLMALLGEAGDDMSVAFLYARPGRGPRTADDLTWASGLVRACRAAGVPTWPVHLADDRQLSVVGPDDLEDAG
jgi:hypothetical protein